jgi:Ricin-type beta-trefoil lectin domain
VASDVTNQPGLLQAPGRLGATLAASSQHVGDEFLGEQQFRSGARPDGRVIYSGPIINRRSDKALDVAGQSTQDGANIQQWGYADQAKQNWDVVDLGNSKVAIISRYSGKAITVQGGRDNNGANIIQRNWNGAPQQRWRLEQVDGDYYRIVSVDNSKCLDVTEESKQNGASIQLWAYANQANQQWRLRQLTGKFNGKNSEV